MTQIHQLCTRKDQEKKFRVCLIFKEYTFQSSDSSGNRDLDYTRSKNPHDTPTCCGNCCGGSCSNSKFST